MRGFCGTSQEYVGFLYTADTACCVLSTMDTFLNKLFVLLCVLVYVYRCVGAHRLMSSCITFHIISLDGVSQ